MKNEYIGMVLSLAAMLINICSFQVKKKGHLLIMQSAASLLYLVSYIFADGGIAVWLNCIFILRNFLYIKLQGSSKKARLITCVMLCCGYAAVYLIAIVAAGKPLAECLWSLFPVIGGFFGTAAVVNENVNSLRRLKLGDSVSWIVYNLHIGIGALGGTLGEIFNIVSICVALFRFSEKRKAK